MKRSLHILRRSFLVLSDQRGVALIASLMIMTSLAILGVWGIASNLIDNRITINYRDHTQAYYAAEAGIERARDFLAGLNFDTELQNADGTDNQLVDSTNINNFPGDDIPLLSNQSIGNGSYTVYLTNDAADGATNNNDTNGKVNLISFGYGPGNSKAVVKGIVKKFSLPFSPPSPIVMPGPDVYFEPGNSNAFLLSGDDSAGGSNVPTVTVSNATAENSVRNGCNPRCDQIVSNDVSPSVVADPMALSQAGLDNPQQLKSMIQNLAAFADFTSTSDPGFNLGTEQEPSIVYINGDLNTGPGTGYGILIVTGTLTLRGNFSYHGVILVVGRGNLIRHGGGSGTVRGAIIIADINGPDNIPFTADDSLGNPIFTTSGGGNSNIIYNSQLANNPPTNIPPQLIAQKHEYE